VQQKSSEKQAELAALNHTIAVRKKYHREQEALIAEMTERGNSTLMELHHDIAVARQQLRDLKTDIRTAAQDKVLLNEDLETMRLEAGGMVNAFA
jgi:hypothetical protein